MTKRVYKFTVAEHGISSLESKRLKLSTIGDLNDPFDDFAAIDTTNPQIEYAVRMVGAQIKREIGLVCFSRNWDNLLMWSHYGDSHTGICLGFDIFESEPCANDVLYQPNLLKIRRPEDVNIDLANRLLRTKHESWSYEQEVRMLVNLNDPPEENGGRKLHWIGFGPLMVLREVIVGAQFDPAMSRRVEAATKPFGAGVDIWWAGMRPDAFLLVKEDHPPHWHAKVR